MKDLEPLLRELITLQKESEWVEFKRNYVDFNEIGEYISALSNSATYHEKDYAYLIWGIDDVSHEIVGTNFDFSTAKVGNEELETWLRKLLSNNANFSFDSIEINTKKVNILTISNAVHQTVKFKNMAYIRVGSYKKLLKDYPAIEAQLWNKISKVRFEEGIAKSDLLALDILHLLDYNVYFELTNTPIPRESDKIMHYLLQDKIVVKQDNGQYAITNLGAILFAKQMSSFTGISRKSVRIIQYKGIDKIDAIREEIVGKGYVSAFEELVKCIERFLPTKEEIEGPFRKEISVYPKIAIRELVANALIHQDLSITGTGPTVEIFENRIEITNPGAPLIDVNRFIDNPPRSRNEAIASLMRRTHICEERGSRWDKIALQCEIHQLPSPKIDIYTDSTRVTLFSYIPFNKIPLKEKKWCCYMHACLKQVRGEQMTNTSLRDRFGLPEGGKSTISRLITSSIEDELIKALDPNTAPRYMSYVPFWA